MKSIIINALSNKLISCIVIFAFIIIAKSN